jgi:hypothetical protein
MKVQLSCGLSIRQVVCGATAVVLAWLPGTLSGASHMQESASSKAHCRTCTQQGAVATPGSAGEQCTYQAALWTYWCDCEACKECYSTDVYDNNVMITEFTGNCAGVDCRNAEQTDQFLVYDMNVKATRAMPNCPPGGSGATQ